MLAAVVGALALFGSGTLAWGLIGGGAAPTTVVPIRYAAPTNRQVEPMPAPAALQDVMSSFRGGAVVSARVGEAPPDSGAGTLPWLYAIVQVPGMENGLDIEPMWEADLLEGALVDRVGSSQNVRDDFGGATFSAVLPNGSVVPNASGGLGDVVRDQEFSTASDADVKSSVAQALNEAGLTLLETMVLHPWGSAPAVIASASNLPAAASGFVPLVKALFGNPPHYEGYYLELRSSATGDAFVRASASFRTGAGRFWVDPKWADLVGEKTLASPRAKPQAPNKRP